MLGPSQIEEFRIGETIGFESFPKRRRTKNPLHASFRKLGQTNKCLSHPPSKTKKVKVRRLSRPSCRNPYTKGLLALTVGKRRAGVN